MLSRDQQRLLKIEKYCLRIQNSLNRFGTSIDSFLTDEDFQQSVSFSVLQIGELVGNLSEEYRSATKQQIPWAQIKGMRNVVAHDYGSIDLETVWSVATEHIPDLLQFCKEQLPEDC